MRKRKFPYRKGDEIEYITFTNGPLYVGVIDSNSNKYKECYVQCGSNIHYVPHSRIRHNFTTSASPISEPSEDIYNDLI